jgi:hypothetical protein
VSLEHLTTVLLSTWSVVVYVLPRQLFSKLSFMNCGASSMDDRQTRLYFSNCAGSQVSIFGRVTKVGGGVTIGPV